MPRPSSRQHRKPDRSQSIPCPDERDLDWAKNQLANADDAARAEWQALVDELEEHQRKAVAELEKIEEAEEDAWAELRHGFIAAYHDLEGASKRAAERLAEV